MRKRCPRRDHARKPRRAIRILRRKVCIAFYIRSESARRKKTPLRINPHRRHDRHPDLLALAIGTKYQTVLVNNFASPPLLARVTRDLGVKGMIVRVHAYTAFASGGAMLMSVSA